MQIVDWLALGIILLSALIGLMLGFGKLLKMFTGGIFGIIISVVVTYFLIGVVASWPFVQALMGKLSDTMQASGSGFVKFLYRISTPKIILGIILFIIVQILRIIIVKVIKGVAEIDNPVINAFNRIGGMIIMLGVICMLALIVFQIVFWIGGDTAVSFKNYLTGALRLDWVFDNNPLRYINLKV